VERERTNDRGIHDADHRGRRTDRDRDGDDHDDRDRGAAPERSQREAEVAE